ncbi:MAG TPA: hypothetical protein VFG54_10630 [Prolixibacteraceae bacterium]|nr:hypothetical protein [Prolixibacteraceae bacterium]
MKLFVFAILVCMVVSCKEPADRYVKRFDPVEINRIQMPDSAYSMDYIQIRAKAQAYNSCWRKLYFELKKTKDFEYSVKAFGVYESFGVCGDIIVTRDTVINFRPQEKGTYLFHISRTPTEVDIDTLVVE